MLHDGIVDILVDLGVDRGEIEPAVPIREALGLDSTEIVELRLEIKERLGVEVDLTRQADFTVAELGDLVDAAARS
ncbi:acyl carrier protein [Amycolatopsis pigmentata]|uniref:Acyl carrier protein n=1 Tax=Amycolatopsis pigmentata TaxID=450801 RepID=A0ABW5FSU3_9PSEU